MIIAVIAACEIGFWVVLAAGLVTRYVLRRRRASTVLLSAVLLVDLVLLAVSVLDLRGGSTPRVEHGLAAVYLGFSVVFGPAMVRWADVRFAHRWAGGPPPAPQPAGGTRERMRLEWREWGRACAAAGVSAALLLGAVALVDDGVDVTPLLSWVWRLALVLAIWLVGWPLVETVRVIHRRRLHPRVEAAHPPADRCDRPGVDLGSGG